MLWENSCWYDRDPSEKDRRKMKIYLYKWKSPNDHVGVSHVYVFRYADFQSLLRHWSRAGWSYTEL
jgi:hypothetical protein